MTSLYRIFLQSIENGKYRFFNMAQNQKTLAQILQIRFMQSKTQKAGLPPYTSKIASSEDTEPLMSFLDRNYFSDEPLIRGARLPPRSLKVLRNRIHSYANLGYTVLLKDQNKKILGVAINRPYPSWTVNRELGIIEQLTCRKLQCYYDLFYRVQIRSNLFRRFNFNYCFHCYLICVDRKYRKKGLATELYTKSRNIAKDLHFDLIRMDCTNHYLSVMCSKLQMDLVYELVYKNFVDIYGHVSFYDMPKPNHCLRVFIEPIVCKKKK